MVSGWFSQSPKKRLKLGVRTSTQSFLGSLVRLPLGALSQVLRP